MPQENYTLNILKQTFAIEVDRTVFDSKSFAETPSDGMPSLNTREERKHAQVHVPLTQLDLELDSRAERSFAEMCKVVDNGKIRVKLLDGQQWTIAQLRVAAKASKKPGQSLVQSFENYAQEHVGRSYSLIISDAQKQMISRFHELFDSIGHLHPMDMTHEEHVAMRENFTHHPVWVSPENLREICDLADQGHVYSQYLAGVLLATVAGEFSIRCIKYLISAYENKVPDAMAVLAEFCFLNRDYLGSVQCALLSVDGGHLDSKRLIHKCYGLMGMQVHSSANGVIFGNRILTQALHECGFSLLLQRVYDNSGEIR
ncbi:SEL1-like repeat protein [Pseudomonas veronii]|uniref:hypothetical protein n=1 Tax=Pseudomonas veronii TaxID=76761 RepID=UPI002D797158|nr:hypothetical protein [Pseudomonas veronii]WRU60338.1 hypothetical protein VPH48_18940 [Pseudomonas veronii]